MTTDQEFRALSSRIFSCRDCRVESARFTADCGGMERPPEIVHGPRRPDLLIISLNPKLVPWLPPILSFDAYVEVARQSGLYRRTSTWTTTEAPAEGGYWCGVREPPPHWLVLPTSGLTLRGPRPPAPVTGDRAARPS